MKNQQKIKQIENKIQEIQSMLTNYKLEITKYENVLLNLTEQVSELKIRISNNHASTTIINTITT